MHNTTQGFQRPNQPHSSITSRASSQGQIWQALHVERPLRKCVSNMIMIEHYISSQLQLVRVLTEILMYCVEIVMVGLSCHHDCICQNVLDAMTRSHLYTVM